MRYSWLDLILYLLAIILLIPLVMRFVESMLVIVRGQLSVVSCWL